MNNGISGYRAGGVNPYRQLESHAGAAAPTGRQAAAESPAETRADLGPDLSDAEAGMIDRKFPETERMQLRLYGPGRETTTIDPGERGRRLDLRG